MVATDSLLEEMRQLAGRPATPRTLPRIEQALVDGCARKLGVEVERLRLERRLRETATSATSDRANELSRIAHSLAGAEAELSALGVLIRSLRLRQRALQAG